MASFRRAKLALDTYRNFTANVIKPRNPIPRPTPASHRCNPPPISQRPAFNLFRNQSPSSFYNGFTGKSYSGNSFLAAQKRFYYVDRKQVRHFRQRGYKNFFQNPRNVFIIVVITAGVGVTIYFGSIETIPYTKRTHLVLLSRPMERRLGEQQFEEMKKGFKGKILPAIHPDSVRVRLISKDVIAALQRGLSHEHVWQDFTYAPEHVMLDDGGGQDAVYGLMEGREKEATWSKEDEMLDDKWVQKSRKKGQEKGKQSATQHLEGLNWEVLVVNEPIVNAFCLPGGKIVVFTGLLDKFRTDAEVAAIIGHEVGHAVARHAAEGITKNLWFAIMQLILYQFVMPDLVNTMSNLLLRLPHSRRMEIEADYIGLLLMASAGYDPRVAPKVYEKLGELSGDTPVLRDYLSTHPSGKKRAKLLAQAKVMEEALSIYREVRAGHGVEGFL